MEGTNEQLMPGDLVFYMGGAGEIENGIVKGLPDNNLLIVYVVYKCNGEWHRFEDYTGQATNIADLHHGWEGGEFRRHECINCKIPTIQQALPYNPDVPGTGAVWVCQTCRECLDFVKPHNHE